MSVSELFVLSISTCVYHIHVFIIMNSVQENIINNRIHAKDSNLKHNIPTGDSYVVRCYFDMKITQILVD
jgi:hypothetical protein